MRSTAVFAVMLGFAALLQAPGIARAQNNLVIDGNGGNAPPVTRSGLQRFDNICLINGATLNVQAFDGSNKVGSGNVELIAGSVFVDGTSKIVARGAGYKTRKCYHGAGPNDLAGGRGGCSVMDSGGGGAHFGRGGRGTIDAPMQMGGFPTHFEDNCDVCSGNGCSHTWDQNRTTTVADGPDPGNEPDFAQGVCTDRRGSTPADTNRTADCGDLANPCPGGRTGRFCRIGPSVAGEPYWHNIYEPEFGAAGGDKGCRDGDGRSLVTGGDGGGRVVVVGLAERNPAGHASPCGVAQGTVRIEGTIDTNGKRGCGIENDSGGGGAGGSVLIVGTNVVVGSTANVSAAGGLGGDTNAGAAGQPDTADCPAGSQAATGECDDCGGGGGGGVISVLSVTSSLDAGAQFNVSGALGGVCEICRGEAGGGAGELQLDGAYVGEYCDGYDNDFDGMVDEGLPAQSCGLGSCARSIAACANGTPVACAPDVDPDDASCLETVANARPRVSLILDTSASMLLDLAGLPTFGDGSVDHPGLASAADSRLYLAREALAQVISAYPEIDFALARYHQDPALDRSCQNAKWFECQGLVGTYDDPTGNTGTLNPVCTVTVSPGVSRTINPIPGPAGSQCINYAGSCGAPRRGADILSGFGSKVRNMVRWLDGVEENFSPVMTVGDVCQHSNGINNCEVRGSGPTPLAGSLLAIEDYVAPIRATDPAAECRGYSVILLTDGAESCNGDPADAARRLHDDLGIDVYVVAVSVLEEEEESLNEIASAGSGGDREEAIFVRQPEDLVPALTEIIAGAIKFEQCDDLDNDCDGKVDEGFPGLGMVCDDGDKGICRGQGVIGCNAAGDDTECKLSGPGGTATDEQCNSLDDDCDGKVDEDLDCTDTECTPTGAEVCNALDDDCDGKVDETYPMMDQQCGETRGICVPGRQRCVAGTLVCVGAVLPGTEICNGKDDDCDGIIDEEAPCPVGNQCIEGACRRECDPTIEFPCPVGYLCRPAPNGTTTYCLPGACALCKSTEICRDDACVDPCEGVECADNETCVLGRCTDCTQRGCPAGEVCYQRECTADECRGVSCGDSEFCFRGECLPVCDPSQCAAGERCNAAGSCERDRCADVSCEDGEVCRGGTCVDDPCADLQCSLGDVCVGELGCTPDPCVLTQCPRRATCEVGEQGQPLCVNPTVPASPPPRYVGTGGSGLTACHVTVLTGADEKSRSPGVIGVLLAAAWVWTSRRRKRVSSRLDVRSRHRGT